MEKRQRSTTDRLSERSIAQVAAHAHSSHDAFRRAEAEMPRPRFSNSFGVIINLSVHLLNPVLISPRPGGRCLGE
jgi:hypothetical protein